MHSFLSKYHFPLFILTIIILFFASFCCFAADANVLATGTCTYKLKKYECALLQTPEGDVIALRDDNKIIAIYMLTNVNGKVVAVLIYEYGERI